MTQATPPPERVAHYRIVEEVSRGETAVVYRAVDETLQRDIALKVLRDGQAAERLIQEARHVSSLQHNFIAAVYQAGEENGVPFIAFEWVEGHTLRQRLQARGMPLLEFYRRASQVAGAVAHAHSLELVHGDLKADNIVLRGDRELKLLDFGLSPEEEGVTEGDLWGTPAYMAPELLRGSPRTKQSDLFALGVLLYEMATGELPFGGADGDEHKVHESQLEGAPTDPRERVPQLARSVSKTILSLLSLDPAQRGPEAAEVRKVVKAQRGQRSSGFGLGFLVVLLVGIVFYWQYARDLGLPWPGQGAEPPAVVAQGHVVGIGFEAPSGSESVSSRFGSDLMALFLNGGDPGSELIRSRSNDSLGDSEVLHLGGLWGRTEDGWQVQWELTTPGQESRASGTESYPDTDPVALASKLANTLRRDYCGNRVATTLGEGEGALRSFMEGVRAVEAGDPALGLERLRLAQDQAAGAFPEAAAWEAALLIVRGDYAGQASRFVDKLRSLESAPGRVIASALVVPVRDVTARWGRGHRLAREFDFVLMSLDPGASDDDVARVGADLQPESLYLRGLRIERALASGDQALVDELLPQHTGHGWQRVVWARWAYLLRGDVQRGEQVLNDWLLIEADDPSVSDFLKVPYLLHRGRLAAATQRAQRLADSGTRQVRPLREAALCLAIAGRFETALGAATALHDPLDPGRGDRLRAAILALSGDFSEAERVLRTARRQKGATPETDFLLDFLALPDPYIVEGATLLAAPTTPRERWRARFDALAVARAQRLAGDLTAARAALAVIPWVGPDMRTTDWPELGYLAWLEEVLCVLAEQPDGAEARREFARFREWWSVDYPQESRVSVAAAAVAATIGVTE
ncbi:MAG: serine/threonine-protein kinase [Planctomycetota bacterium]